MKKVISLLVVLVISAVSLSACGKERTKTYEGEVNGKASDYIFDIQR